MSRLPAGFAVRLAPKTRVFDTGRTLLGGTPARLLRLTDRARMMLDTGVLVVDDEASATLAEKLLDSGVAVADVSTLPDLPPGDITCVVPVHDRPEGLDRLLSGLHGWTDVIVVDDASCDAAAIAEVTERHAARLIRLDENVGPGGARNAGLAAVTTPFVVFLDSDVVVAPEDLNRLLRHFHDPAVGLAAPRIGAIAEIEDGHLARYESVCSSLDLGPESGTVRPLSPLGWVPSAVLAARVEAMRAGFDPTMRVGEDVDLVWRVIEQGWHVRYDADVIAHHDHRTALGVWLRRKADYGTSAADLAARHGSSVAPAVFTPIGAALAASLLVRSRWDWAARVALVFTMYRRVRRSLGRDPEGTRIAAMITAQSLASIASQSSSLMLRHWWPLTALCAVFSRRFRALVVAVAVADAAVDYRRVGADGSLAAFALLRRLDDVAYGAGVWAGAVRHRSLRALTPRLAPTRLTSTG